MKVAVLADTHDHCRNVERAVSLAIQKKCAIFLHCGDFVAPFLVQRLAEFKGQLRAVFGNNDGDRLALTKVFKQYGGEIVAPPLIFSAAEKRVVLLHEPFCLDDLIGSQNYDFIFYGHLHNEDLRVCGKTMVLNPGDGSGWIRPATFYIVELETKHVDRFLLEEEE